MTGSFLFALVRESGIMTTAYEIWKDKDKDCIGRSSRRYLNVSCVISWMVLAMLFRMGNLTLFGAASSDD